MWHLWLAVLHLLFFPAYLLAVLRWTDPVFWVVLRMAHANDRIAERE